MKKRETTLSLQNRLKRLETKNARESNSSRWHWIDKLRSRLANRLALESITPSDAICKNVPEAAFHSFITSQGYHAAKKGWPDFFCWKDGELILVEVKPDGQQPRQEQWLILQKLSEKGIPCYTWTPKQGLVPVGLRG